MFALTGYIKLVNRQKCFADHDERVPQKRPVRLEAKALHGNSTPQLHL